MSRVTRVYLPPTAFGDHEVRVADEASHYLGKVLRLRPGDRWAALDGRRRAWLCEIVDATRSRKLEEWPAVPPLAVSVELGLALCKGSRFEDALEKLAELGVVRVVPLETERTERGVPSSQRLTRWDQIAKSGSALANRLVPLEIAPPQTLAAYVESLDPSTAVYCHHDGAPPRQTFRHPRNVFQIVIGPEGGFAPAELELLHHHAKRVSLGPLTLRVETAAVCAAAHALSSVEPPL
jgi:16S rRNA (uracil1498-N3)-methyltransferase